MSTVGVVSIGFSACETTQPMKLAVVGHVEWAELARVKRPSARRDHPGHRELGMSRQAEEPLLQCS